MAVNQLVNASRILAYQGIADDGLGHISIRDPLSPDTAFLVTAGSKPAAQITPADIAVVRINDSLVTSAALAGYPAPLRPAEIFIHSSIYQRFPNTTVNSIAYYQTEQLLPWTLFTGTSASTSDMTSLYATTSGAAFMGVHPAPVFDAFDADPSTTTVIVDNVIKSYELSQRFGLSDAPVDSINQTGGFRPLVLMRNDGATVVGTSVPETVFRFVQAAKSARVQFHAAVLNGNGTTPLYVPNAAAKTSDAYLRRWLYWMTQIEDGIRDDSARSPELWQGDGDPSRSGAAAGSKNKNGATTGGEIAPRATMLVVVFALTLCCFRVV